jgi:pyruvate dehydrogenase (quinone)
VVVGRITCGPRDPQDPVAAGDAAISGTYLTKIINKRAAADALFAADDGTAAVWMLRHIDTGDKRCLRQR